MASVCNTSLKTPANHNFFWEKFVWTPASTSSFHWRPQPAMYVLAENISFAGWNISTTFCQTATLKTQSAAWFLIWLSTIGLNVLKTQWLICSLFALLVRLLISSFNFEWLNKFRSLKENCQVDVMHSSTITCFFGRSLDLVTGHSLTLTLKFHLGILIDLLRRVWKPLLMSLKWYLKGFHWLLSCVNLTLQSVNLFKRYFFLLFLQFLILRSLVIHRNQKSSCRMFYPLYSQH